MMRVISIFILILTIVFSFSQTIFAENTIIPLGHKLVDKKSTANYTVYYFDITFSYKCEEPGAKVSLKRCDKKGNTRGDMASSQYVKKDENLVVFKRVAIQRFGAWAAYRGCLNHGGDKAPIFSSVSIIHWSQYNKNIKSDYNKLMNKIKQNRTPQDNYYNKNEMKSFVLKCYSGTSTAYPNPRVKKHPILEGDNSVHIIKLKVNWYSKGFMMFEKYYENISIYYDDQIIKKISEREVHTQGFIAEGKYKKIKYKLSCVVTGEYSGYYKLEVNKLD